MIQKKNLSYFWHVLLWSVYSILPVVYTFQRLAHDPDFAKISTFNNPTFWVFVTTSSIFLFYLNAYYLIPKFYKKRRTFIYFLLVGLLILSFVMIRGLLRYYLLTEGSKDLSYYFYFNALIPYFFIYAVSTTYHFFIDYQNEQKRVSELENERLRSELSFLRSQISPHFMFNLMNSMVSLARKKSDLLEPMLLKMSDLLRYMLYEKEGSKITLEKESNYLANYIELQKLRFGKKVAVTYTSTIEDDSVRIEPMLLIPFVENAFKHGTGLLPQPTIDINLKSDSHKMQFEVRNFVSPDSVEAKDASSGIGLVNVKRRLDLLYPNQHKLLTSTQENSYIVHLTIYFA